MNNTQKQNKTVGGSLENAVRVEQQRETARSINRQVAELQARQAQSSPLPGDNETTLRCHKQHEKAVEEANRSIYAHLYPKCGSSALETSIIVNHNHAQALADAQDEHVAHVSLLRNHAQALANALEAVEAFWNQPPTGPGADARRRAELEAIRSNNAQTLAAWKGVQS